ncbi:MAG: hypothetical protein L0H63_15505, partial [Nitrococcus sp.]|nr:hypothetical protein [Nitrococcus sp.]
AVGVLNGTSQGLAATVGGGTQNEQLVMFRFPNTGEIFSNANRFFGTAITCVDTYGPVDYFYVGAPGADYLLTVDDVDNGLVTHIPLTSQGPTQDSNELSNWQYYWGYSGHQQLGTTLTGGRFRGLFYEHLASSIPGDADAAGGVVLSLGHPLWERLPDDFSLVPQPGSRFGQVVAVGDFNGRGPDELVIGTPDWDVTSIFTIPDFGLITVVDDTLFASSFE